MTWSVPKMWPGETCAILASGPSMSQEVADTVMAAGIRAITVNTTFKLAPWADMFYAADVAWWKKYHGEITGLKVTCEPPPFKDILQLKNTGRDGFDPNPAHIRTGNNGGYQAIHIAAHTGCSRILLCGFDMRGGHWHDKHPEPLRDHGEGIYQRWLPHFKGLGDALEQRGIEVLNCTPNSALKRFPMADLREALACPVLAA
jgi:hypothetical protein